MLPAQSVAAVVRVSAAVGPAAARRLQAAAPHTRARWACSGPQCGGGGAAAPPPPATFAVTKYGPADWRRLKYRLTHLGIKEIDLLFEHWLVNIEESMKAKGTENVLWSDVFIDNLTQIAELETQAFWAFLFDQGALPQALSKNPVFLHFVATVQTVVRQS